MIPVYFKIHIIHQEFCGKLNSTKMEIIFPLNFGLLLVDEFTFSKLTLRIFLNFLEMKNLSNFEF